MDALKSNQRTFSAAISHGEMRKFCDPWISEEETFFLRN